MGPRHLSCGMNRLSRKPIHAARFVPTYAVILTKVRTQSH
ncbi:hypothetical protein QFZ54_000113 [Sphingomonas faeni]|nr:hypothetical protein [Sphingomonas faeni]